jgi:hypothetical protein
MPIAYRASRLLRLASGCWLLLGLTMVMTVLLPRPALAQTVVCNMFGIPDCQAQFIPPQGTQPLTIRAQWGTETWVSCKSPYPYLWSSWGIVPIITTFPNCLGVQPSSLSSVYPSSAKVIITNYCSVPAVFDIVLACSSQQQSSDPASLNPPGSRANRLRNRKGAILTHEGR